MRRHAIPVWAVLMTAGLAAAQEAVAPAVPPPLPPLPSVLAHPDDSLLSPSPVGTGLWKDDAPSYHFYADVGFDILWTRLGNPSGPAIGPNVSVGVFNDRGAGVDANWMELDQSTSRSGSWGPLRRP
jgi:hypothetical protein